MNFANLISAASKEGFDLIKIHAKSKGMGVCVSLETRNAESAAVSMFELPNAKFDSVFLRRAMEERMALVEAGWDLSFDAKSLTLKRLSLSEIAYILAPEMRVA